MNEIGCPPYVSDVDPPLLATVTPVTARVVACAERNTMDWPGWIVAVMVAALELMRLAILSPSLSIVGLMMGRLNRLSYLSSVLSSNSPSKKRVLPLYLRRLGWWNIQGSISP